MRHVLALSIALLSIGAFLLSFGLPNYLSHPTGGTLYGGSSFLNDEGEVVNYYDPIYRLTSLYGILVAIVGFLVFLWYRTSIPKVSRTSS